MFIGVVAMLEILDKDIETLKLDINTIKILKKRMKWKKSAGLHMLELPGQSRI